MNLHGEMVNHKSFGKGQIVENTKDYVCVNFNNCIEKKSFKYPDAFELYLELDNKSLMLKIKELIKQQKLQKLLDEAILSNCIDNNNINSNINFEYNKRFLKLNKQKEIIKNILKNRDIKYLVHFTRIENLPSILKYGLIPVSLQSENKIISVHNDKRRFDSKLDCTSCSVSFPNYKLLYKFRNIKYTGTKWVVINIDTDILFSLENISYFCNTNAARVFSKIIDENELCSAHAFENMFCERIEIDDRSYIRKDLSIESYLTTDPQAEILISNVIDPKYIKDICFEYESEKSEFFNVNNGRHINKCKSTIYPNFFNKRKDSMFW